LRPHTLSVIFPTPAVAKANMKVTRFFFIIIALLAGQSRSEDLPTSNLVFLVDKSLSKDRTFIVMDDEKRVIDKIPWFKERSDLYRGYIVAQKEYRVDLLGPIRSVTITTQNDQTTYLRISPYFSDNGTNGVQITSWSGSPGKAVEKIITDLKESGFGEDIKPVKLGITGKTIQFFPDAPWPVPPPPK